MEEVGRLILLLAIAGVGLTLLGGACIWFLDERRRMRRSLRQVLKGRLDACLTTHGRGLGFDFRRGATAVTWDGGRWCLAYRTDELRGAELIVDEKVAARVVRGESGRPIDRFDGARDLVRLRLLFDDPSWPDFHLDLWRHQDSWREGGPTPSESVQEAARWISRVESLFRQPPSAREAPEVTLPPAEGLVA